MEVKARSVGFPTPDLSDESRKRDGRALTQQEEQGDTHSAGSQGVCSDCAS